MPHLRVIGQSLHIIILVWTNRVTRVSTVSFAVVLCSGRVGFSDYKLLIHAAIDNPFLPYYIYDKKKVERDQQRSVRTEARTKTDIRFLHYNLE